MKCPVTLCAFLTNSVAPVRERGLKSTNVYDLVSAKGRSRKGAWIEILIRPYDHKYNKGRSRKGAWIEISIESSRATEWRVAPVRERGLKWVVFIKIDRIMTVAPVRERGLKSPASRAVWSW